MHIQTDNSRIIFRCFLIAVCIEAVALFSFGHLVISPSHSQPSSIETTQPIEAELFRPRHQEAPHLRSETPTAVYPQSSEPTLSKTPDVGKETKPQDVPLQPQHNQTLAAVPATPAPATHGPECLSSPAPVIPDYLRNDVLKTSVVIEFLISKEGRVAPTLLSSSDNEELDQIALRTARKWTFKPAEKDGVFVDSKLRLRIEFEIQ